MQEYFSLVSLFPPLLVLILGYLTHRVILALSAGIILAALIANNFALINTIKLVSQLVWGNLWQTSNLCLFIFLLALGIFVTMLQHSGGAYAYGIFAKRKIKNAKSAETASLILSTGLFADDYLSSLTVGSVMYPLTDTQNVPRAKLAYLVDSMSAPLAILCPFSSWVAAIMGFLIENGINENITATTLILANPLTTFLGIIPFIFYSFVVIASIWFIVRCRISFGIMKRHEEIAKQTGNLFGGLESIAYNDQLIEHNPEHTTLLEFFLPIVVLLMSVLGGILYTGNWVMFGGQNSFMTACQNSSAAVGLFIGGNFTVLICTMFFMYRGRIRASKIPRVYSQGIKLMAPAILVLLLAWTLGDLLRVQLHTGEYLASLLSGSVNITFLPFIFYITATVISFTIGTSWGTAAMLFPIAIPLVLSMAHAPTHAALSQIPILFPVLGGLLSGCLAGNHVSPISDTTIMSSLSTRSRLTDHVCTQLQYAMPGIFSTGLAFLLSGLLLPYGLILAFTVSLLAAIATNILILWILNDKVSQKTDNRLA